MDNQNLSDLSKNFYDFTKAWDSAVHHQISKSSMGLSPIAITLAISDWLMHLGASPGKSAELAKKAFELTQRLMVQSAQSHDPSDLSSTDLRFKQEQWGVWPYSLLKDIYLAHESWMADALEVDGMNPHNEGLVQFYSRQFIDSVSPSNFPLTNPQFLTEGLKSGGQSWWTGFQNFWSDWSKQISHLNAQSSKAAPALDFEPGIDVALTPGKVVYENRLIELIQYEASTKKVHKEPLLVVPSCIMKYYILDLSPKNSMVKFLVDQGFTVFMISWRNPDESDRNLAFNDYLNLGVLDAMRAIKRLTKSDAIHSMGYCLGGTFLAAVAAFLGHFQHQKSRSSKSKTFPTTDLPSLSTITLLAAQTDFSEPGQLGLLVDQDQLKTLKEEMARTGFLSGKQMAASFQFLNARDLIWARNTKRYLLGENETGNDMVSWNSDVTRLPEKMHNEYLDHFFLNNSLSTGYFELNGHGIALMDIHSPLLVVGTARDTVSPWKSVYKIQLLTNVETTFILTSGGHNAGIVSEPGHPNKSYQKCFSPKDHGWMSPKVFLEKATQSQGSWWPEMSEWLAKHSSGLIPALSANSLKGIRNAPGQNVLIRYED
jgi:polyhydroxyalkanoate synthase